MIKMMVRYYSEEEDNNARPCTPNLEDVFLVTHWDFSEDEPGNVYSGYYYYKPGDTKGGITMKYSNGNTKETGYHSVDSAEDALGDILS